MRISSFRLSCLLLTGILALTSCNMPANNPAVDVPTQTDLPTATQPPVATETPLPSDTPTATATETPVSEPSETPTPEVPKAEVVRETNCRIGPGGLYDLVAKYPVGQALEVVAKDLGGGYWFVRNPDKSEEPCYLLAQNIKITGDTSALPQLTPLPSPTAMPYFEVAFKKLDTCEGQDYALFTIENVGSVPFRSVYIKVTSPKGDSVEQVMNAFDLKTRCVLAKNIAPLDPGASGYVYSPPFTWSGHSIFKAVIMACTEKNLKGTCVTQSVDVKQ